MAGVAGILNVLTQRLGRIVDRTRVLEGSCPDVAGAALTPAAEAELDSLWVRIWLINASIVLCTCSAVLVGSVVAVLFLGTFVSLDVRLFVAVAFIAAMVCVVTALLVFLAEIHRAITFARSEVRRRNEARRGVSPPRAAT
jgi:hypothetical protein